MGEVFHAIKLDLIESLMLQDIQHQIDFVMNEPNVRANLIAYKQGSHSAQDSTDKKRLHDVAKCINELDGLIQSVYDEMPGDMFRRHDNCDCTIIYDGQVLRGQLNLDGVTRNTTWQQIGDVPAEYEPTSFTQEQAKELERQNLQRFRRLTNGENSGKIKTEGVKPMTISSIDSPIEQRHNGKGNPNAINIFGAELNNRQKLLLEKLPEFDSRTIVPKDSVNMADLAALTAETGDEFAMFTKRSDRLIIRGNEKKVNIDVDAAEQLAKEGYRWSGHTHPGIDFIAMQPSDGDYAILDCFKQESSVIYNSKGDFRTFERRK